MKGYKGFDKDMKCRGFQYEVGKSYTHEGPIDLCSSGFHFCENPLDIFEYYGPAERFAEVEASDVSEKTELDNKRVAKTLRIVKEISLSTLCELAAKLIVEKATSKISLSENRSIATNTGYRSASINTGYGSVATNTGLRSAAANTGYRSASINTGYCSAATNTGDYSAATTTGRRSAATNTGRQSAATNIGDWGTAANTGDYSAATNTGHCSAAENTGRQSAATNIGDHSAATNTGRQSVATNIGDWGTATNTGDEGCAISLGIGARAKGAIGCWLTLAEWKKDANNEDHRVDVRTVKVDGEKIKANVFYVLVGGEFMEETLAYKQLALCDYIQDIYV